MLVSLQATTAENRAGLQQLLEMQRERQAALFPPDMTSTSPLTKTPFLMPQPGPATRGGMAWVGLHEAAADMETDTDKGATASTPSFCDLAKDPDSQPVGAGDENGHAEPGDFHSIAVWLCALPPLPQSEASCHACLPGSAKSPPGTISGEPRAPSCVKRSEHIAPFHHLTVPQKSRVLGVIPASAGQSEHDVAGGIMASSDAKPGKTVMPQCDSEQLPRKLALIGTRAGGTESENLRDCAGKTNLRRRSARKKTRKSRSRSRRPSSRAATSISRHLSPQNRPTFLIRTLLCFGSGGADATPHARSISPLPRVSSPPCLHTDNLGQAAA